MAQGRRHSALQYVRYLRSFCRVGEQAACLRVTDPV